MERIYIISDIHANLPALEAVLSSIRSKEKYPKTRAFCLGDVVDCYFYPIEVIGTIKRENIKSVIGDHDYGVILHNILKEPTQEKIDELITQDKIDVLDWTALELIKNLDALRYLNELPLTRNIKLGQLEMLLSHGRPSEKSRIGYSCSYSREDPIIRHGFTYMENNKYDIWAVGHMHCPVLIENRNGVINLRYPDGIIEDKNINRAEIVDNSTEYCVYRAEIREGARCIFNPGSVGMFRDIDLVNKRFGLKVAWYGYLEQNEEGAFAYWVQLRYDPSILIKKFDELKEQIPNLMLSTSLEDVR